MQKHEIARIAAALLATIQLACASREVTIEIGLPEAQAKAGQKVDLSALSRAASQGTDGDVFGDDEADAAVALGAPFVDGTKSGATAAAGDAATVPIAVDRRAPEFLFVFADGASVRTAPQGSAPIERTALYGERVQVQDRANGFVRIGPGAWVKRTDLTDRRKLFARPEEIWFVRFGDPSVHERPDSRSKVVGKLTSGDRFEGMRTADASDWIEISDSAYVRADGLGHAP